MYALGFIFVMKKYIKYNIIVHIMEILQYLINSLFLLYMLIILLIFSPLYPL